MIEIMNEANTVYEDANQFSRKKEFTVKHGDKDDFTDIINPRYLNAQ